MSKPYKTSTREDAVDAQLKRAFADLADEPLPDRFSKLLDDLRESEHRAANSLDSSGAEDQG